MVRNPTRRRLLQSAGAVVCGSGLAQSAIGRSGAQSQDQWRHFNFDAMNTGNATTNTGPVTAITSRWTFATDRGVSSSPAVVDGTVYVGSADGSIYALSAADGTKQWTYKTDGGVGSSPAVVNDTVYVGSQDNSIYALSAADGTEQWTYETGGSVVASPAIRDGTLYVGSTDSVIYALSATDGAERWTYETGNEVWSSPAVRNGTVYIGSRDNLLYALTADDGTERWTHETGGWIEASPAVTNGTVYVGSLDSTVYALATRDGREKWTYQANGAIASSPALTADRVYAGSDDNHLYALSAADGAEQWAYETGDRVFSSPAVTGDTAYIGSADGRVYAISAADGTERWGFETAGSIFSSPAVAGGTVFIGSADAKLYALGGNTAVQSGRRTSSTASTGSITDQPDILLISAVLGALGLGSGGFWFLRQRRTGSAGETASDAAKSPPSEVDNSQSKPAERGQREDTVQGRSRYDPPAHSTQRGTDVRDEDLHHRSIPDEIPGIGECLVEYETLSNKAVVGRGPQTEVLSADLPTATGTRTIALKEPRVSGTLHGKTIEKLLEGAELWHKLDEHDHIVTVYDYSAAPLPWIAMEYMDGGHLGDRAGTMPTSQGLWTAIAITKGVRHAHRRGVTHLNLKPENVLFSTLEDKWDIPKVSDWGLSSLHHSTEQLSPQYAAPEQLEGSFGPTDDITDIYQLGVVFYELFTGQPPFERTPSDDLEPIIETNPTPPSDIADLPSDLDEILLTALATQRTDRYDSIVYLRDALGDLFLTGGSSP